MMIPTDPSKSVAGMRKLAEMYNVPVVLGPLWHAPGLGNPKRSTWGSRS